MAESSVGANHLLSEQFVFLLTGELTKHLAQ